MPLLDEILTRVAWSVTPDESAVRADLARESWILPSASSTTPKDAEPLGPVLERIP